MYNQNQLQSAIAILKEKLSLPSMIQDELARISTKYISGGRLATDEAEILDTMLLLAADYG